MRVLAGILAFSAVLYAMAWVPDWYESRSYQNHGSVIYGYGVSDQRQDAIADAKAQIIGTLKTKISSTFISSQSVKDDQAHQKKRRVLNASSSGNLIGAEVIRDEQTDDGKWYVAVKYLNLTLAEKAEQALKDTNCTGRSNDYMDKTPLVEMLNAKLSCKHAFELTRFHRAWYISSKNFKAPLSKTNFDALFKSVYDKNLDLIPSSKLLYEDEVFNFIIRSKKAGYVSLLSVYEDGKVGVMLSNASITPKHAILFPKADADVEMVAGLVEAGKPTQDLYVLIYSESKIDMTRFERVTDQLITSEQEFRFSEVIKLLKKGSYTTLLLKTLPKSF